MAANNVKSPTSNVKPNRLPAPTLFVGPPSRNASQLSVSRLPAESGGLKANRAPLHRQASARSRRYDPEADDGSPKEGGRDVPKIRKPSDKSIDARWREMQSTLNEVELTAQGSTHVFGEGHARALDDLRDAQVALARAWGRGNEDKATASQDEPTDLNIDRFKGAHELATERRQINAGRRRADTEASASTVLSDESVLSDSSAKSGRSHLEDETAQDIRLASERRAANEAYFKKVDQGVREVVERLEKVAEAMRGVEGESRSLWSESTSSSGSGNDVGRVRPAPPDIVLDEG